MSESSKFQAAYPFQRDVLALPVLDLESTSSWYCKAFGMHEVERNEDSPSVFLERDGVRVGFAINGGDATQEGAAILVEGIAALRDEFEARGLECLNWRVDKHDDGHEYQVFFVRAPDELCYYFHERL